MKINYEIKSKVIIMFKQIALIMNWIINLCCCYYLQATWLIVASPIFHTFTYFITPHCYANHCTPKGNYEECGECGLKLWIRMHHCYRCGVCVHKFDHHCYLLDICIGEANQKYYFMLLWAHLFSSCIQINCYFDSADPYVWIDENGFEHMEPAYVLLAMLIIFSLMNIIVVGYMAIYHTYVVFTNNTTYELKRRPKIKYLPLDDQVHYFDNGLMRNLKETFLVSRNDPIQWQVTDEKQR